MVLSMTLATEDLLCFSLASRTSSIWPPWSHSALLSYTRKEDCLRLSVAMETSGFQQEFCLEETLGHCLEICLVVTAGGGVGNTLETPDRQRRGCL